jgi:hypothetical protein
VASPTEHFCAHRQRDFEAGALLRFGTHLDLAPKQFGEFQIAKPRPIPVTALVDHVRPIASRCWWTKSANEERKEMRETGCAIT